MTRNMHLAICLALSTGCGGGISDSLPDTVGDTLADTSIDTNVDVETAVASDIASDDGPVPQPRELRVEGPNNPLPGRPAPIAIRTDAAFSGRVLLRAGDLDVPVEIRHGRGSAPLTLTTDVTIASATSNMVVVGSDGGSLTRSPLPERPEDLIIADELIVAADEDLVIAAGTRIILGPTARLIIHGTLRIEGTPANPVLVTSRGAEPFGTIEIRGGTATIANAWFTNGGASTGRFRGHSDSDPVIAVVDGRMTMVGGGIVDNPGKAVWAERSWVRLENILISRCDTGGEYVSSVLEMIASHTLEIPDGDGIADDDDNDGIYLRRSLEEDGVPLPSRIADCVFAFGEDDGIDHNGAHVEIVRTRIDGFRNEGLAASDRGEVIVRDSVVTNNTQGIEAGYGGPTVTIEHTLLTSNDVGLRWGDAYPWESTGTIAVSNSIIVGNKRDVDLVDPQQGSAPEGDVTIGCSVLGDATWAARDDNAAGVPRTGWLCPELPRMSPACSLPVGPELCR